MIRNRESEFARLLSEPEFSEVRPSGQSRCDYDRQTLLRARSLTAMGVTGNSLWLGRGDASEFPDMLRTMGWIGAYDLSLLNVLVSHQIAGDALLSHGDGRQVDEFAAEIRAMTKVYCFAASELHAGSDLKRIGTTATYRAEDHSLVLHTPAAGDTKAWTGNSLHSGDVAMVLCRLVVDGRAEGHHWLRVPIRAGGRVVEGVRIEPMEPKGGVEANQTALISFDRCVLPVSALMARWAVIDERGAYGSSLTRLQRFNECLATFTHERMMPACGAAQAQRLACAITSRYAAVKRVVHAPLLERGHYRLRLAQCVARAMAGMHAMDAMAVLGSARTSGGSPARDGLLHTVVACNKTGITGDARQVLSQTRELCGGLGYHHANQIIRLLHDYEISVTFGGDNTVISYQAALLTLRDRTGLDALLGNAVGAAEKPSCPLPGTQLTTGRLVRWMSLICQALLENVRVHGNGPASVAWSRAVYQTLALGQWALSPGRHTVVGERLLRHYAAVCLLEHAVDAMGLGVLTQQDALQIAGLRDETGSASASAEELLALLDVPEALITAPIAFPDFADRHLAYASG